MENKTRNPDLPLNILIFGITSQLQDDHHKICDIGMKVDLWELLAEIYILPVFLCYA